MKQTLTAEGHVLLAVSNHLVLIQIETFTRLNTLSDILFKTHVTRLILPHIECVPTDDDVCLTKSPGWASNRDCAYAKNYCNSWAKDARRCCPQTCESGLLTKAQCENLDSKGTCIYPTKSQCPNEGIKDNIGFIYCFS